MEENRARGKVAVFFESKGFYVVLALCVSVIGVSAWLMLTGVGLEQQLEDAVSVSSQQGRPTPNIEPAPAPDTAEQPSGQAASDKPDAPHEPAEPEPAEADEAADTGAIAVAGQNQPRPETAPAPVLAEAPAASLYVWPVMGQIDRAYSSDALAYDRTMNDWRTHPAVDLAADAGTQVMAAASGTVSAVYDDPMYGTTVVLDHGGGLQSVYSSLAAQPTVAVGDGVTVGEVIGALGDTALCESAQGPHLHFAMLLDGAQVDPGSYLPERGA